MNILNKAEHSGCFHYEGKVRPTVEIRRLEQGHEEEMVLYKNEIVFMVEGEIHFSFRDYPGKIFHVNEFIFIPMGGVFRYTILEKALIVVIRLNNCVRLCNGFRIEDLYRSKNVQREIVALEVNRPLQYFLDGLQAVVQGGLNCREYFDIKARELCLLLMNYYSREALREFFALILSPDTLFSEYVRANFHRHRTIGELAASMNVSVKHFEKVFTRVFGMPPGRWLNEEKMQMLYPELRSGTKPLKQITYEFGFSNQQQLNRFCKRKLKKTPGEIRRERNDK